MRVCGSAGRTGSTKRRGLTDVSPNRASLCSSLDYEGSFPPRPPPKKGGRTQQPTSILACVNPRGSASRKVRNGSSCLQDSDSSSPFDLLREAGERLGRL